MGKSNKIENKKVVNNNKTVNNKKKNDKIVLSVLVGVIILLVGVCIYTQFSHEFKGKSYSYDYLKFSASNYIEREGERNSLVKKDKECYIEYNSIITNDKDLMKYGNPVEINDNQWVKQDFDNGVTWMSYYKSGLYIVQMYGKDDNIYKNECKDDFEKIKSTFSFLKSE